MQFDIVFSLWSDPQPQDVRIMHIMRFVVFWFVLL